MPKIITGLDVGSGMIKILIAQKTGEEEFEVLAQAKENSFGVRKGIVFNVEEVTKILQPLLKEVKNLSKKKINSAYVNVSGAHIFSTTSRGSIAVSRADQKISQEDIDRVIEAAQTFSLPSNKEILDIFPKEFIIDGEKGFKEPLGLEGVRLEVETLVFCGFSPYIKNLAKAVLNAGLQIDDLILTPLASARAVLTDREKELGVLLLDIGAGTTGLSVFEEGDLIHLTILPIGSSHITNDIAIGLRCDIDLAERIKLEFGNFPFHKKEKTKIKLETLSFSKKVLEKIIGARVSEIFGEVNKELKKISRKELLPAGVVLTGGGAKLPRIVELAKRELKLPARLGQVNKGFFPPLEDPSLATVSGLVLLGADLGTERPSSGRGIFSKLKRIFKIFIP